MKQNLKQLILTSSLMLLSSTLGLHADPNEATYNWAHQMRESVRQVQPYTTEQASEVIEEEPNPLIDQSWPHGSPKNLLQPITPYQVPGKEPPISPAEPQRNKDPRNNGSSGGDSNASITVNINPESEILEVPEATVAQTTTSRLEELYKGQFTRKADRALKQFGYNIFSKESIESITSGPTPGSYVIGPGDEILITLSGAVEGYHELIVTREGQISIPDFGTVKVSGVRNDNLYKHIFSFLEQQRRNFTLTVSVGNRRTIQVNVVGQVGKPGRVEVPALSNMILAMSAAGGVSKDGSLRSITLRRSTSEGEKVIMIDLYDYLQEPTLSSNFIQLQEQDTLYIPSIGPTIGIAGYVLEPGIYELDTSSATVAEALELAGGLTPFSFTPHAQIERTIDGRGRRKFDVILDENGLEQAMQDGELLMIEAVDTGRQTVVRIEGEIVRPGDYEFTPGMRLSDLIARADGLTIDAHMEQVFISRQIGGSQLVDGIAGRSVQKQNKRVLVTKLSEAIKKSEEYDLELMPLDLITIRSSDNAIPRPIVEIIGAVQRPGKYELTASMRVSDLIAIAGNLTPTVYYDQAELVRRSYNYTEPKLDVTRFRFNLSDALNPEHRNENQINPILSNGDQLIIRTLHKAYVRVRISGRVSFPGEYIFPDGATITDLIQAAGGILEDADLRASVFTRESTRRLQQTRLDNLVERTRRLSEAALERMVQTGRNKEGVAAKIALEQTRDLLSRLDKENANGRIVIPFEEADFPKSPYNLALQPGDALSIPRKHSTVSVSGDVFRPITFIVTDSVTVEDALKKAGGLTEMAHNNLLYIIRANGEIERSKKSKGIVKKKTKLYAGDVLLAPTEPMKRTLGAQFTDLVMLTRQLAEIAVIVSNGDESFDVSLVSPFTPEQSGINANVDAAVFIDD